MWCIYLRDLSSCSKRTSTCTNIDKSWWKCLWRSQMWSMQIPPTKEALEHHVERVTYQGGHHIQGQSLLVAHALPLPTSWGWRKTKMVCMNQTGWQYLRHKKPAVNLFHANARKVVGNDANARRLHLNAGLFGGELRGVLFTLRWTYIRGGNLALWCLKCTSTFQWVPCSWILAPVQHK